MLWLSKGDLKCMEMRVSIFLQERHILTKPRGTSHCILHDDDEKVEFNIFLELMDKT